MNDKNDANAHHHNLAVHCRGMGNQANMNNLEVGARVKGLKRTAADGPNQSLVDHSRCFCKDNHWNGNYGRIFITELDQKEIYLNEIEVKPKNLGNQVAALSNENKIKSEQLLDLSNKVLELPEKYARDVTALSTALDKAQEEVTVIFSEKWILEDY